MSPAAWVLVHLLVGAVGAGIARAYARRRALFDQPGERRSHAVPTPRGGGVAITAAMLVATALLAWRMPAQAPLLAGFGIGLAMVALVGFLDDHRPLPAWSRLAVHLVAGGTFASATWWQFGDLETTLVAFIATVALVNVWNFMDGINGLASTQAVLAAAVPALAAGGAGAALGLALIGATLGFLPWNFPRGRLFLGDVGSGTLGFSIGALVAMAVASGGMAALLVALVPLSAFMVDAGLTLARRVLRGERWWQPHVTHAFQQAARRRGHAAVTLAFGAWTLAAVVIALATRDMAFTSLIISLLAWYASGAAAWWLLQCRAKSPVVENRE